MTKADEIRAESEKAEAAAPIILSGLRNRLDPVELARDIASRFELEERTAYRWVTFTEEKFDSSRKRIAAIGIAVLCVGFAAIGAGVVLRILQSPALTRPIIIGLAAGLPLAAAGLMLGIGSRKIARVR